MPFLIFFPPSIVGKWNLWRQLIGVSNLISQKSWLQRSFLVSNFIWVDYTHCSLYHTARCSWHLIVKNSFVVVITIMVTSIISVWCECCTVNIGQDLEITLKQTCDCLYTFTIQNVSAWYSGFRFSYCGPEFCTEQICQIVLISEETRLTLLEATFRSLYSLIHLHGSFFYRLSTGPRKWEEEGEKAWEKTGLGICSVFCF